MSAGDWRVNKQALPLSFLGSADQEEVQSLVGTTLLSRGRCCCLPGGEAGTVPAGAFQRCKAG